jgi:SAM-dependent methyltransferase
VIPVVDGIADFIGPLPTLAPGADRYRGISRTHGLLGADLPARIKAASGGRWPAALGDTLEFGCGLGSMTEAIITGETVRDLLVLDTDRTLLQACQARITTLDTDRPVAFAALADGVRPIRDAVADTVIGTVVLSGIDDTRGFLTMVHRVLRIGGRALFVVPNRRYHHGMCLAIAEALTQQYALTSAWPDGCGPAMTLLEETRRLLLHRGDRGFPHGLETKHLFDSDALEAMALEIGFASAEMIPLDPDPAGGETITRLCQDAGAADDFAQRFGPLAATIGRPYLSLLGDRDASAFSLLWLTKATGPAVRIYTGRPPGPRIVHVGSDAAVGGVMPRWSIELLARGTPEGVRVTVGGWCLTNIDALWVRITLDGVAQETPVWRHRPDVHEVLNRARVWHSLNALCSGLSGDLLFAGVHAEADSCALRVEIILTGGLIVTGPAPDRLPMNQQMVIGH